ncbi:Betaine--homocysteine S-methyltransferase 1 [Liparis tanakae]|uniref:Betaine--homocysteine S-methyltransferase 1 n=1 Tax=Liparis tanakae TaxID=230148 RepID=A0A4Z2G8V8_9TELE|nr:Betaine--homocysteine S-methyltransferase 1 [Liparis tanakae]
MSNDPDLSGILDRLNAGEVVVGDGGYVMQLERRGYVKAGHWTPEAAVEHPEAVRQLHREFLRAGADVIQTFTFYCSEDKLEISGNVTSITVSTKPFPSRTWFCSHDQHYSSIILMVTLLLSASGGSDQRGRL